MYRKINYLLLFISINGYFELVIDKKTNLNCPCISLRRNATETEKVVGDKLWRRLSTAKAFDSWGAIRGTSGDYIRIICRYITRIWRFRSAVCHPHWRKMKKDIISSANPSGTFIPYIFEYPHDTQLTYEPIIFIVVPHWDQTWFHESDKNRKFQSKRKKVLPILHHPKVG